MIFDVTLPIRTSSNCLEFTGRSPGRAYVARPVTDVMDVGPGLVAFPCLMTSKSTLESWESMVPPKSMVVNNISIALFPGDGGIVGVPLSSRET